MEQDQHHLPKTTVAYELFENRFWWERCSCCQILRLYRGSIQSTDLMNILKKLRSVLFLHQNNNNNGIESVILVPLPFAYTKRVFFLVLVFSMCWFDESMLCQVWHAFHLTRLCINQFYSHSIILHGGSSFVTLKIFSGMNFPNLIIFD